MPFEAPRELTSAEWKSTYDVFKSFCFFGSCFIFLYRRAQSTPRLTPSLRSSWFENIVNTVFNQVLSFSVVLSIYGSPIFFNLRITLISSTSKLRCILNFLKLKSLKKWEVLAVFYTEICFAKASVDLRKHIFSIHWGN